MSTQDTEKLEASIHRVLRSLPDRRAPASLEARVLAELSRRAALPWWRKSYAYWPLAVRVGFLAGSGLAAALIVSGIFVLVRSSGATALAGDVAQRFSWLILARELLAAAGDRIRALVGAIPPLWIYGAVGAVALCYATLAAIGAATYRTLTFARQNP